MTKLLSINYFFNNLLLFGHEVNIEYTPGYVL